MVFALNSSLIGFELKKLTVGFNLWVFASKSDELFKNCFLYYKSCTVPPLKFKVCTEIKSLDELKNYFANTFSLPCIQDLYYSCVQNYSERFSCDAHIYEGLKDGKDKGAVKMIAMVIVAKRLPRHFENQETQLAASLKLMVHLLTFLDMWFQHCSFHYL